MKKHLYIIFMLLSFTLFSQNDLLNEAKYWVWRDRLVNDWMVPNFTGDYAHPGRGIVFGSRGTDWWQDLNYNIITDATSYSGGFDVGDEGFQMGKYLIVLATEWRLLFNSGLPTEQTEAEIYWELTTIDRLDYDAETYWSYFWSKGSEAWSGDRNGFMIRDDVFTNFLWYNANYPTQENNFDNSYFNFFKLNYSDTVPPYLNFYPDAFENYKYLNQGSECRVGKYIEQNIMLCNPSKSKIYDLRELMRKTRNTHHINGYFMEFNHDFPYLHITEPYGINTYYYPNNGGLSAAMAGLYSCYDDNQDGANYDREDFREHHWIGPEEYSLDNYIGLLQGLVTVKKLVSGSSGLSDYASEIIKRIISSIKNNSSYNNNWAIDNIVTGLCVKGVFWDKVVDNVINGGYNSGLLDGACNQGGAQAGAYSGQFAKVYEKYVGGNYNGQVINGVIGSDNALLSAILVTMTGYLPSNLIGLFQNEEKRLKSINKKCCKDWIDHDESDANKNEFQYLDLLFCYLHGLDEPYRGFSHYYDIINSIICPNNELLGNLLSEMIIHNLLKLLKYQGYSYKIIDSYNYPIIEYVSHWTQQMHFQNQDSSAVEFALDYLFEHPPTTILDYYTIVPHCNITRESIYFIESASVISTYNGEVIENDDINVPIQPNLPCKSNVIYKTGKEIHLKPGFKVINGAKFHGYIEPMDVCPIKEGNLDVAVLSFPPSEENLSPYVSNLTYCKIEMAEKNEEIKQVINNNKIQLLPNPAKDILVLQSNESENYLIEIYDIMGQLIEKNKVNTNENISVGYLKRGVYIFKVFNQNELVQLQKIILQ